VSSPLSFTKRVPVCSLRVRSDFHVAGTGRAGIIGTLLMSRHRGDATFRSADAMLPSAAGLSDSDEVQRRLVRPFEAFFFAFAKAC
jgi:hypothetical protein